MTEPLSPAGSKGKRATPPSPRLDTVGWCRRELAALYKEARLGLVPAVDASRLANVVQIIMRAIEGSDLEARLQAIEQTQAGQEKAR